MILSDDGLEQVSDVFHVMGYLNVVDDHLLAKVHLHQDMVRVLKHYSILQVVFHLRAIRSAGF
jgi:hypothetical protein